MALLRAPNCVWYVVAKSLACMRSVPGGTGAEARQCVECVVETPLACMSEAV